MNRYVIGGLLVCALLLVGCRDKKADNSPAETAKVPDGTKTIKLADGAEVTWIRDNPAQKLNPRELFPAADDELWNGLNMPDGLPATVSTFLLKVNGEYILFDAGLGDMGGQMRKRLSELGISPDEIKLIYLTHFHRDHIGGLITAAENGQISRVFANAEIYASQTEYDAWMNNISNNDLQKNIMGLYQDKLHLFAFRDTLPHNVTALDAVGHTPGHTAYRYNELLIVGDLMHGYALQKDHPEINSIYDMDKDKSAQSRIRLMKYAQDNHLIMAGMHLPEPGFIQ
ncbi:MAG: MBL fold metallo-hydrolase [Spirochaetales bacterium]|nr:MBL fold metallo-hydrolase [Spirochaetales bacterium]